MKTITNNLRRDLWFSSWGAFVFSLAASGCTTADRGRTEAFDRLPSQLQRLVDDGFLPGAITMVVDHGDVIHQGVVGYEDVSTQVPMHENTIFRLYSMSKPITSVGILILVEEGRLTLDDAAEKYIPSFAGMRVYVRGDLDNMETEPADRPMTIRDLLTHSSGITYHFTGDTPVHQYYRKYGVKRNTPVGSLPTDGPPAESLSELVARIAEAPLLHQPGERFSYSYSTTVLGYVIEQVSGKPLDEFLEERVFQPLEMSETGFFVQGARLNRFVTNYMLTEDGLQEIENSETTDYKDRGRLLDGGGALAGTAGDYMNFAMMLANGGEWRGVRILRPETVREMFEAQIRISGMGAEVGPEFGLGLAIGDEQTEANDYIPNGFFGWEGSGNTLFWVNPDEHLAVVFLTQVLMPPQYADRVPFRALLLSSLNAYMGTH